VAFLVLTHAEVERALTMDACIDLMAMALTALARGDLSQPLRSVYVPPRATGAMAWMPAHRADPHAVYGMKILCVIPDNPRRGLDGHQGAVVLLDGVTGELRALVNAAAVTAIRTAAVSAGARACSPARMPAIWQSSGPASRRAGTSRRSRACARSSACESPVAPRTAHAGSWSGCGRTRPVPWRPWKTPRQRCGGAAIVAVTTMAREPVLAHAWLAPDTHVNAAGASQPPHREIDTATWAAVAVFVDRRESVENEAADYRRARDEGTIGPGHIRAELGDVLLGWARGRTAWGGDALPLPGLGRRGYGRGTVPPGASAAQRCRDVGGRLSDAHDGMPQPFGRAPGPLGT